MKRDFITTAMFILGIVSFGLPDAAAQSDTLITVSPLYEKVLGLGCRSKCEQHAAGSITEIRPDMRNVSRRQHRVAWLQPQLLIADFDCYFVCASDTLGANGSAAMALNRDRRSKFCIESP
jgi:hypothetical protein